VVTGDSPAHPGRGPGAQLGHYLLVEEIGRGGMAVVYRALDVRLDRWVALKILSGEAAGHPDFRHRFIRESRAAASVDHPNIIPIFEAGEADGVLFIAMRYASGRDVHSLIQRAGPLPPGRAVSLATQVASALDAAHAAGLVHRDVKPANMLLDQAGPGGQADHVYLSDFGISKSAGTVLDGESSGGAGPPAAPGPEAAGHASGVSAPGVTGPGTWWGTRHYAAPEQLMSLPVDERADVYSLGCSVYEMLAGEPPFTVSPDPDPDPDPDPGMGPGVSLGLGLAPLSGRRPDIPAAADEVLARAMALIPEDRYESCGAFVTALASAFRPGPGPAGATAARITGAGRAAHAAPRVPRRGRRAAIAAAMAVAALAAAGTTVALWPAAPRPPAQGAPGLLPTLPVPTGSARAAGHPAASRAGRSRRAPAPSATGPSATDQPGTARPGTAAGALPPAAGCPAAATAIIPADCYRGSHGAITVTTTGDPAPAGADGRQVARLARSYLEYPGINFGSGANHFSARVASGAPDYGSGGVDVVLDNPANQPVAGFSLHNTGGWSSWVRVGSNMTEVTGVHNVYIEANGGPAPYLSLHWFTFHQTG
jgi:Protein kinase domain/Carbohydrate binding module (family 6)